MTKFDLTYATVDSLSEGVGSSQIAPLMEKLAIHGMKINLLTFEKEDPPIALKDRMAKSGITWTQIPFGLSGPIGGIARTIQLARLIPDSLITHARSDFPAVAARLSGQKRVLWDVRSLWADQRKFIEESPIKRSILSIYTPLEEMACNSSLALSTLTKAVVPILEDRHKKLPGIRTVVPTAVDLERFKFSPVMSSKLRGLYSGTYNNYYDCGNEKVRIMRSRLGATKRIENNFFKCRGRPLFLCNSIRDGKSNERVLVWNVYL